jgi:type II secretion system protein N
MNPELLSPDHATGLQAPEADGTGASAAGVGEETASGTTSGRRGAMRLAAWSFFFVGLLIFFTLLKIPERRIHSYVQGTLSAALAPRGISISPGESRLSLLLGPRYTMRDVTLNLPAQTLKIDEIDIKPSFFSALFGKLGTRARIRQGKGELDAFFAVSALGGGAGASDGGKELDLSFEAEEVPLFQLGLVQLLAPARGEATFTGSGSFSGKGSDPSTWKGELEAKLLKLALEPQTLMGFKLPGLKIGESRIEVAAQGGKAQIRALKLGKSGASEGASSQDDLTGEITGEILLGKTWGTSNLNLSARFRLSQAVTSSLSILEMILGNAKQADGSYAYSITGSLQAPAFSPVTAR